MTAQDTPAGAAGTERLIFEDDFTAGLDHEGPQARWQLRPGAGRPEGDGVVSSSPAGLVVTPTSTEPTTGLPAFALDGGPGHLRWVSFANRTSLGGTLGFDVPEKGRLTAELQLSAELFNTALHPYGDEVQDPDATLRCGMGAMVCVDLESGIVFDFALTNKVVWALYERLPRPGATHGVFSYAVPVAERTPGQQHRFAISVDAGAGRTTWSVDGTEAFTVDRIGRRLADDTYLARSTEGPDEDVEPRQFSFGFGMFADPVWGQGVRLRVRRAAVRVSATD
ncbi:DUF6081 family protein [Kitasatospora indigofera]|uniref:DUF6081 family protein n=1 Tax=Kitasatospora indigofera TaxID=67307 RepID=UPI00325273B3